MTGAPFREHFVAINEELWRAFDRLVRAQAVPQTKKRLQGAS